MGDTLFFFRRPSLPAARPPFTIHFEMTTGKASRQLPTVRLVLEEWQILEAAGAVRIKVMDSHGLSFSKSQLRDLVATTPAWSRPEGPAARGADRSRTSLVRRYFSREASA